MDFVFDDEDEIFLLTEYTEVIWYGSEYVMVILSFLDNHKPLRKRKPKRT